MNYCNYLNEEKLDYETAYDQFKCASWFKTYPTFGLHIWNAFHRKKPVDERHREQCKESVEHRELPPEETWRERPYWVLMTRLRLD